MDSDGDFSDELLELAGASGAPDKKRKKRHSHSSKSSKRRKADMDLESEDEQPESEEADNDVTPYPLEGKYIDEADRQSLLEMSEIDREGVLAQRLEEMQHSQDTRALDQLVKAQKGGDTDGAKAAKRSNATRGLNKEKDQKLSEYKAKRMAKGDKKKRKTNSPKRDRSSSPMDMETDSDEEEDGQISKLEEQEERDRKLYGTTDPVVDENITVDDLCKCQITRDQLAKHYMAPWFEDYVKGTWVRYCIGQDHGAPVYRICEVTALSSAKNYKINNQTVDQNFSLKHGASIKDFPMDRSSNSQFEQREFERLVKSAEHDKIKLPTKKQLEKKLAEMVKYTSQPVTESDVSAMLARKKQINSTKHNAGWLTMEKSRLNQARTLALRRQDYVEMASIDEQLAELNAANPVAAIREDERGDILAKVNERNRKSNVDAIRKVEQMEADRKRRDRKLAAAVRANASASPAPSALLAIQNGLSRPGTPAVADGDAPDETATPLPPSALAKTNTVDRSFEASIASIEVDLGDF